MKSNSRKKNEAISKPKRLNIKKSSLVKTDLQREKRIADTEQIPALAQIFKHTSDLVWMCDVEFNILFINQAFKVLTGINNREVIGKNIGDVLFVSDAKNFYSTKTAIRKFILEKKKKFTKKIYHRIKRKNQPELLVESVLTLTNEKKNQSARILGITRTVATDSPAEEKLKKTNLSLTLAQKLAHLGTYQFDEKGKNNLWSEETFKIFSRNVKAGAPSYEEFLEIVHPEDRSLVKNSFISALTNNTTFNIEFRVLAGKKIKYLRSIGQVIHDSKMSKGSIFGTVMDITDSKISEENLGKYLFELKKNKNMLEDRAMELASLNEQLSEASGELGRTLEAKDKFFSILAHDLRSPFHGLLGFANMLIAEYDNLTNEERKDIAERINQSALYVFKLIENLLDWSRLESGRMEMKLVNTDLNETVLYIFNLLNNSAAAKDIKLINRIAEGTYVIADTNMINSVIENLLSNAIKFTKRNTEVILECRLVGELVEVIVKDKGVGIKKADIEKLFKIDSHHSTPGTEDERGTGFGLILCREMIEKMGGSINVSSKENEGSVFSFTLPAVV